MISLKSYLSRPSDRDLESAYRRMLDLFLQAVSLHAVEGDKREYERFRADMDAFAGRLASELSIADRFLVVGEILRALEDYNRQTSKFLRVQNAELQKMIAMLTQTVIAVGANSETSVAKLQEIEKALEQWQMLEDIHAIKAQLGECLLSVRGEAQRQKAEAQVTLESLQQEVAHSQGLLAGGPAALRRDPATNLLDKSEAERALRRAVSSPDIFVLVAVVSRVQAVNARFGYSIGDQILCVAAENIRAGLSADDKLFRWHGPGLLALLTRQGDLLSVRNELRRFIEQKLEKNFVIGSRAIMLPVSTSWAVFPLVPPIEATLRKIEIFTSAQVSHDYV
jgi:GGDEF domain-containing protein